MCGSKTKLIPAIDFDINPCSVGMPMPGRRTSQPTCAMVERLTNVKKCSEKGGDFSGTPVPVDCAESKWVLLEVGVPIFDGFNGNPKGHQPPEVLKIEGCLILIHQYVRHSLEHLLVKQAFLKESFTCGFSGRGDAPNKPFTVSVQGTPLPVHS